MIVERWLVDKAPPSSVRQRWGCRRIGGSEWRLRFPASLPHLPSTPAQCWHICLILGEFAHPYTCKPRALPMISKGAKHMRHLRSSTTGPTKSPKCVYAAWSEWGAQPLEMVHQALKEIVRSQRFAKRVAAAPFHAFPQVFLKTCFR